jgi:hypothetical protein
MREQFSLKEKFRELGQEEPALSMHERRDRNGRAVLFTARSRDQQRNGLASVAPIDAKMAIGGPEEGIVVQFGHSHEAGIREVHRQVAVFFEQLPNGRGVILEGKVDRHDAVVVQPGEGAGGLGQIAEKVQRFSDDSLAGEERWAEPFETFDGPGVVEIGAIQQCN